MALRRYIKVTGAVTSVKDAPISRAVTIYGRAGAQISRSDGGEVLVLKGMGAPEIKLFDLEIVGNGGSGGKDCVEVTEKALVTMTRVRVRNHNEAGITLAGTAKLVMIDSQVHDNRLEGVNAGAGTTLELHRTLIYKNASSGVAGVNATSAAMVKIDSSTITTNTGTAGGVSITGPFSIKNSIITVNGNVTATTVAGGANLNPVLDTNLAEFDFNTVADNQSASGAGLSCFVLPAKVTKATNSIITGNTVHGCEVLHSLAGITGTPTGTNKVGDPMFVTKALLDPMFYRIGAASAARGSADPTATLDVDIDGDPRTDARKDIGADEYK